MKPTSALPIYSTPSNKLLHSRLGLADSGAKPVPFSYPYLCSVLPGAAQRAPSPGRGGESLRLSVEPPVKDSRRCGPTPQYACCFQIVNTVAVGLVSLSGISFLLHPRSAVVSASYFVVFTYSEARAVRSTETPAGLPQPGNPALGIGKFLAIS